MSGSSGKTRWCSRTRTARELLGELAGMVVRWVQAGRPRFNHRHRCAEWAAVIGGILEANGLPEFLANMNEAAGDFNAELEGLAALAEAAMEVKGATIIVENEDTGEGERGLNVAAWEPIFRKAGVLADELAAGKSQRSKETRMGDYLGKHLGRSVPICARAGSGTATLRRYEGRGRRRLYFFQIVLTEAAETAAREAPEVAGRGQGERVPVALVEVAPQVNTSLQPRIGPGNQEEW